MGFPPFELRIYRIEWYNISQTPILHNIFIYFYAVISKFLICFYSIYKNYLDSYKDSIVMSVTSSINTNSHSNIPMSNCNKR